MKNLQILKEDISIEDLTKVFHEENINWKSNHPFPRFSFWLSQKGSSLLLRFYEPERKIAITFVKAGRRLGEDTQIVKTPLELKYELRKRKKEYQL